MANASVSFNVGTSTSIAHNNRENVHGNPDIDLSKIEDNITYIRRDIKEVYAENFDEPIMAYNKKQKRSDRKINDYYKKILNDKKTEHQREIIVAVGTSKDDISHPVKSEILDDYMKHFEERNPNLKVYNAVLHLDEANPHLHINYVPVAEYSRGLSKRVAQNKALEQQGHESFGDWRKSETELIEKMMAEHRVERKFVGSHEYRPPKKFKELEDQYEELKSEFGEVKEELENVQTELAVKNNKIKQADKVMTSQQALIKNQAEEVISLKQEVWELRAKKQGNKAIIEQQDKQIKLNENKTGVLENLKTINYSDATYSVNETKKYSLFGEKRRTEWLLTHQEKERLEDYLDKVSRSKPYNQALSKENSSLREENERMKDVVAQNSKLRDNNQTLKEKNTQLSERNKALETRFEVKVEEEVERRHKKALERSKWLSDENFKLTKQVNELNKQVRHLTSQMKDVFETVKDTARDEVAKLAMRIPLFSQMKREDDERKRQQREMEQSKRIKRPISRGWDLDM